MTKFLLAAALIPALAAGAFPARAADAPALQLVQPGDRAKSCDALATEINGLAANAGTPAPRKRHGLGLGRALGMAAPMFGGFGGGMGGALVSQAAGVAESAAARSDGQDAMTSATGAADDMALREERRARLMSIIEEKHC